MKIISIIFFITFLNLSMGFVCGMLPFWMPDLDPSMANILPYQETYTESLDNFVNGIHSFGIDNNAAWWDNIFYNVGNLAGCTIALFTCFWSLLINCVSFLPAVIAALLPDVPPTLVYMLVGTPILLITAFSIFQILTNRSFLWYE